MRTAAPTQGANAQQADTQALDAAHNAAQVEKTQTEETMCLAKDRLAYDRIMVAQAKAAIAAERANPSGVVDLVRLHDLGVTVQSLSAHAATLEPALAKLQKSYA